MNVWLPMWPYPGFARFGGQGDLETRTGRPVRIGFFGTGLIARYIHTFLAATGWTFDDTGVHDRSAGSAAGFRGYLEQSAAGGRIAVHERAEDLIRSSDLVVFATIAGQPHVSDLSWFGHNPLVLHIWLRDLAPQILIASGNIVGDVEHTSSSTNSAATAEHPRFRTATEAGAPAL